MPIFWAKEELQSIKAIEASATNMKAIVVLKGEGVDVDGSPKIKNKILAGIAVAKIRGRFLVLKRKVWYSGEHTSIIISNHTITYHGKACDVQDDFFCTHHNATALGSDA